MKGTSDAHPCLFPRFPHERTRLHPKQCNDREEDRTKYELVRKWQALPKSFRGLPSEDLLSEEEKHPVVRTSRTVSGKKHLPSRNASKVGKGGVAKRRAGKEDGNQRGRDCPGGRLGGGALGEIVFRARVPRYMACSVLGAISRNKRRKEMPMRSRSWTGGQVVRIRFPTKTNQSASADLHLFWRVGHSSLGELARFEKPRTERGQVKGGDSCKASRGGVRVDGNRSPWGGEIRGGATIASREKRIAGSESASIRN